MPAYSSGHPPEMLQVTSGPDQTVPSYCIPMKAGSSEKRNVTTAQAIAILKKNGREVSEKEAEKILDLMYFLAKLVVNQNVKV